MTLPTDSADRKDVPLATGLLDYFPDALAAVARLSKKGNDKHNPGEPLHWSREKSSDHADCVARHLLDRDTLDTDGELHDVHQAWRSLAQAQIALERRGLAPIVPSRIEVAWSAPNAGQVNTTVVEPKPFTYWYVATPYTKYLPGCDRVFALAQANKLACMVTARLLRAGIPAFSPIAHSHAIAVEGLQDVQVDHEFWVKADAPLLNAASGMIVITASGWQESRGMAHEIEHFHESGKPVVFMAPDDAIPKSLLALS